MFGFIKFNGSGANYGTALASGIDPTDIRNMENSAKGLVKMGNRLKPKASPNQVLKMATIAQQQEDNNDLLAQESQQQVRVMKAGIQRLKIAQQHRKAVMGVEEDWQDTQSQLTRDLLKHRMALGMTQAESVGTQRAYSNSSPLDRL